MFLLVPAYPGCPGSKAVKRSLLYSILSLRTPNALDAPVSHEQVRLSRRLKHSVLPVESRIKSGRDFQAIGTATENARRS